MIEIVVALSIWLSASHGLAEIQSMPRVRFLDQRQVAALRYGRADVADVDEVVAVYDPVTRTIVLPDTWDGGDPADLSVLVHEIVHHLQREAGTLHRCPEEAEARAYAAQERWLSQFGLSLEKSFGIDAFSLKLRTNCLW
ncbi:hypothetical protein FY036_00590 [Mesorhizobium microcysteis]|jgi:hypothetical protein|uniref:DUF6647 domain-containing protein n=1 Tax=Neoaquamicrobium microcysteis TaxID=2682781 RepID=A0A5D4HBA3_9HYPH|nr:DUF6647 family protein [Mesorhizobium microcysteis]TYR36785.1 hypothetical protein FY036_00590 [Mesorhizobium microcysteis]